MPINKRTYPSFILTHSTEVTIYRKGKGGYVDGRWEEATEQEVKIQANVQPIKFTDLQMFPESDRTREWIVLYSVSDIRTANEGTSGWEADEVSWNGNRYKVMKANKWVMGVLDHVEAYAAREPISAGV